MAAGPARVTDIGPWRIRRDYELVRAAGMAAAMDATVHDLAVRRAARITPGTDHWILRQWPALNPDEVPPDLLEDILSKALRLSANRPQPGVPRAAGRCPVSTPDPAAYVMLIDCPAPGNGVLHSLHLPMTEPEPLPEPEPEAGI